MKLLEIKNLNYAYKENRVLSNLSFEVQGTDFACVLGVASSGKTTLLKLITKIIDNPENSIIYYTKKIAYIPQNIDNFFVSSFVGDDLMFSLKNTKISKKDKKLLIEQTLKTVGLEGFYNRAISTLSGGERQRACLAAVLIKNPEIILLDDSFCFLDDEAQNQLINLLKNLTENNRTLAIIYATSNQELAKHFSKVITLKKEE